MIPVGDTVLVAGPTASSGSGVPSRPAPGAGVTGEGTPVLLSILVPAYAYPEGVRRILEACTAGRRRDVEVIVSDDSEDEGVARVVGSFDASGLEVSYRHNRPALGPAGNWNALVGMARGEYCLLIHHDEFPLTPGLPDALATELEAHGRPDVLLLRCVLVEATTGRNRLHVPDWLRELVVRRAPGYLFRRNVIGPLSVVVARRAVYPRFDASLRWLIDVDACYRLLRSAGSVRFCRSMAIGSMGTRRGSITAGLGERVSSIAREERRALRVTHGSGIAGLKLDSGWPRALGWVEGVAWLVFRALTRGTARLLPSPYDPRKVRALLGDAAR
jgi:hypothetical protein